MEKDIENLIEKLSLIERKILPYLKEDLNSIIEKSKIDKTSVLRALKFLENKNIVEIKNEEKEIVELSTNGIYYKKKGLPERQLLTALQERNHLTLQEAKEKSKISENEFKVSLGILKSKALIELKEGKIQLTANAHEIVKRTQEEKLIDELPLELSKLEPEQKYALENLKKRKEIIEIKKENTISYRITDLGKKLEGKNLNLDLIEELTPEIIKSYENKKFRAYDIKTPVPKIYSGKKHFVNKSIEQGRKIWLEMGFKEMDGPKVVSSFWNFDALFTAQDHPVREMHDTFFIKKLKAKLPNKEIVEKVKQSHEKGTNGSKGWNYKWNEEQAKKVLLRTHTTALSSMKLAEIKKEELPAKYFAIGKCFRNETIDWKHGFEFNQTEGIVIDENANLRNLIGYLKEFAKKMGFEKVKFQPSFFPYTEPSIEGLIWNEEKKQWIEVFAAGIFRPEVTTPLLGKPIPVLAWGPGFDRLMMMANKISDIRELYSNNIKQLRNKKI
jgi:phenylalanyl-tRNA synthetase alpha chain